MHELDREGGTDWTLDFSLAPCEIGVVLQGSVPSFQATSLAVCRSQGLRRL